MNATDTGLPLVRPVIVSQVRKARVIRLTASQDERRAVADYLGLQAIDVLEAAVNIRPWRRRGLWVEGKLNATIDQICTITAEPMKTNLSEAFDERFYPEAQEERKAQTETVIDVEATDDYETFVEDTVDLGALMVEYLSLAVDPYPKRPGAVLPGETDDSGVRETDQLRRVSPFAGLADRIAASAGDGGKTDEVPGASGRRNASGKK